MYFSSLSLFLKRSISANRGGDGATRPLPMSRDAKKLHRDPIAGPRPQDLNQTLKM